MAFRDDEEEGCPNLVETTTCTDWRQYTSDRSDTAAVVKESQIAPKITAALFARSYRWPPSLTQNATIRTGCRACTPHLPPTVWYTNVLEPMPAEVDQEFVLAKCDSFVEFQLWPLSHALSPEKWLGNFDDSDLKLAVHLLNSFIYFSEPLVDELFSASIQRLSSLIQPIESSFFKMQVGWKSFLDSAIVTYVTGESPSPTDSGYTFSRKARQVLGIPEARILHPHQAINALLSGGPRPILFVDDFVGSGNQFIQTWNRTYPGPAGVAVSFATVARLKDASFWYCPLLCTQTGLDNILRRCRGVRLSPAHVLSAQHSAVAVDSLIWPTALVSDGREFVRKYSERAGISDDPSSVDYWQGFQSLGLTFSFAHSVPDATLPLFYWEQNGWLPLIRRT